MVAAYFAAESYIYERSVEPADAVVWVLNPHILNEIEGFKSITPPIDAHMCEEMLKPASPSLLKKLDRFSAPWPLKRTCECSFSKGALPFIQIKRRLRCAASGNVT